MAGLTEGTALNESERGKAAIIVTELATNLVRYATGGEILLAEVFEREPGDGNYVVPGIVALDRGPGIADLARCLEDGFSTGGTPGTGLGAARRFVVRIRYLFGAARQPSGTVVFARVGTRSTFGSARPEFKWGVVARPALHEEVCGDCWRIAEKPGWRFDDHADRRWFWGMACWRPPQPSKRRSRYSTATIRLRSVVRVSSPASTSSDAKMRGHPRRSGCRRPNRRREPHADLHRHRQYRG